MAIKKSLRCPQCSKAYDTDLTADAIVCPHCQHALPRIDQVSMLLEEWYYPRRWQAAVQRPRARLLIERLWQQQFEPFNFYTKLAPRFTSYDVFCYTVTDVIINGVHDGWAKLSLPEDPLVADPLYKLEILDLDRFSAEMEKAFPNIEWDEDVEVTLSDPVEQAAGAPASKE